MIIFSWRKTGFSLIEEPLYVVYLIGTADTYQIGREGIGRLFAECHWIKS